MPDLFTAARPLTVPPETPAPTLRGALARTVAHMEALTFIRRDAEGSPDGAWWPGDGWLRTFAVSPLGRDQAARLQKALRRLAPEERRLVAEELLR